MSIIIIMLVFEPIWSHCPEICDHFRQSFQSAPAQHDCTFMWFLLFSIITLSPVSLAHPTSLSRHQQVIVIMNSEITGLIRVGFMLRFERRSQYNSLTEWFTKSIRLKNILVSLHSSIHYLSRNYSLLSLIFFSYLLLSILVLYFNPWLSRRYQNYQYIYILYYLRKNISFT